MHPQWDHIIKIDGFELLDIISLKSSITYEIRFIALSACPHCNCTLCWARSKLIRTIRHWSIGNQRVYLKVHLKKLQCQNCNRYFTQRLPGILPYQRSSELFKKEITHQHHHGITQSQLAKEYRMGAATIERWYHSSLKTKLLELKTRHTPRVLGIDEHFFTRKKGYATTIADLSRGTVFDVRLGRSEASLKHYLERLEGKHNTKVILMDLSETYRSLCKKYFCNAVIVADRFHVVRLINHTFLKVWSQLDPNGRKNRGLLSLVRRHEWNLKPEQKLKLREYLKLNPVLEGIYDFKQKLNFLMIQKKLNKPQWVKLIPEFLQMIEQLKTAPIEALRTLGKTLNSWKEEIARMWRFTKTNSITEGLHTKMEMLSRRAFGFKNFDNYRIRVLSHCGGLYLGLSAAPPCLEKSRRRA